MSDSPAASASFRVYFGADSAVAHPEGVAVAARPLGERNVEELFGEATALGVRDDVRLFQSGGLTIGTLRARIAGGEVAQATERTYARMLAAVGRRRLFRVWNYVPRINAVTDGLENYRAFCVGRARAFEVALGAGFAAQLPAASAVGCDGDELVAIFAAGEVAPRHFENPAQVPAYEYPSEHGPRSPSFARATVAEEGARRFAFLSGTAAIRGHATVGAGDFEAQLACTLENLRLISREAGLGEALSFGAGARRFFKVYLRRAEDYARTKARLEQALVKAEDAVIYLRSDICRAALDVEIEATLVG